MNVPFNVHPGELELETASTSHHPYSRIAGLERLQSPALKSKILPWLGAVRGGDSESDGPELFGHRKEGEKDAHARSARSAPALSPLRPLASSSHLSSKHAASSPPPLPAGTLGSPIRLPSAARASGDHHYHRRHVSVSTGAGQDHEIHGEGTVVSEGSPLLAAERSFGRTPASGTVPSIFDVLLPSSPLPAVSSAVDQDIIRSQAHVRSQAGGKAPNIVPLPANSPSSMTDTSFGNSPRVGKLKEHPSPLPTITGRPERKTLPLETTVDSGPSGRNGSSKASLMPIGVPKAPAEARQHRSTEDEVTQAPPDSPFEKPPATTLRLPAIFGTSPPQPALTLTGPSSIQPIHAKISSTETVTPTSQPERPRRPPQPLPARTTDHDCSPFDWPASLFEDKVLCELLEFLGKPGVTTETRKMLMDLLSRRMTNLQTPPAEPASSLPSPKPTERSATPSWAIVLQHEVALLRQEILDNALPTAHSPPSGSDADSFFAGPKGLLFQRDPPQTAPPVVTLTSFGVTPAEPGTVPPVLHPSVQTLACPEQLSSAPVDSGLTSLRTRIQPPSPAVALSANRSDPDTVAHVETNLAGSGDSDPVSAVTAATSPASALNHSTDLHRPLSDTEQAVRDLIERSLPPTPPSEPDTLAPHNLVPQLSNCPHAMPASSDAWRARPPTDASTLSEDPIYPKMPWPRPWDLVTQRLYAWAILWQDESYTRSLEEISLDGQVSSFALTIWTTVSYKRWLRSKICAAPHDPVDKLFVPPSFGDLLNKACFHRNYKDAAEILLGLWTPFQLDRLCESGIPRVIVALARHRNDDDAWAVHRFDVSESSMTTWLFATGEQRLKDERTVAWWHAIRGAWPTAGAKCPSNTSQAIQHIILPAADKHDVSLAAVNCFRNVLLGWRWDRETDKAKLRELVWSEVRRLFTRKSEGALAFEPAIDSGRVDDL